MEQSIEANVDVIVEPEQGGGGVGFDKREAFLDGGNPRSGN